MHVVLNEDEQRRAKRYLNKATRYQFIWMRAALRMLLAERFGLEAHAVELLAHHPADSTLALGISSFVSARAFPLLTVRFSSLFQGFSRLR